MGVDLLREDGHLHVNNATWASCLALADTHGWCPKGSVDPQTEERTNVYTSCDGYIVEDDDARNLAAALERALPTIPDEELVKDKPSQDRDMINYGKYWIMRSMVSHPLEWLSGETKTRAENIVDFCKAGGFRVY